MWHIGSKLDGCWDIVAFAQLVEFVHASLLPIWGGFGTRLPSLWRQQDPRESKVGFLRTVSLLSLALFFRANEHM